MQVVSTEGGVTTLPRPYRILEAYALNDRGETLSGFPEQGDCDVELLIQSFTDTEVSINLVLSAYDHDGKYVTSVMKNVSDEVRENGKVRIHFDACKTKISGVKAFIVESGNFIPISESYMLG